MRDRTDAGVLSVAAADAAVVRVFVFCISFDTAAAKKINSFRLQEEACTHTRRRSIPFAASATRSQQQAQQRET